MKYLIEKTAVFVGLGYIICSSALVFGFETTKILPEGVRNVTIKSVNTSFDEKTNRSGTLDPLARSIEKDLTYKNILKNEEGLKKTLLKSFLSYHGINNYDESLRVFRLQLHMLTAISVDGTYYQERIKRERACVVSASGNNRDE